MFDETNVTDELRARCGQAHEGDGGDEGDEGDEGQRLDLFAYITYITYITSSLDCVISRLSFRELSSSAS
jgi:hypothetical protein